MRTLLALAALAAPFAVAPVAPAAPAAALADRGADRGSYVSTRPGAGRFPLVAGRPLAGKRQGTRQAPRPARAHEP